MYRSSRTAARYLVGISVAFFNIIAAGQTILRVDGDNGLTLGGGATGASWPYAFKYLNDAIDVAINNATQQNPYQIWVKGDDDTDGIVYYPDEGANVTNNVRSQYFELADFVSIYCGFEGDEAATDAGFNARDHTVFRVTLSGDIDQDGLDNGNAYHVIRADFVDPSAIVDGATITGGYANGSNDEAFGGGILIVGGSQFGTAYDSQPKILRCRITGNFATSGGGVYIRTNETSDPEFRNSSSMTMNRAGQAARSNAMIPEPRAARSSYSSSTACCTAIQPVPQAARSTAMSSPSRSCRTAQLPTTPRRAAALWRTMRQQSTRTRSMATSRYTTPSVGTTSTPARRQATPLARSCPGRSAVRRSISTTHA